MGSSLYYTLLYKFVYKRVIAKKKPIKFAKIINVQILIWFYIKSKCKKSLFSNIKTFEENLSLSYLQNLKVTYLKHRSKKYLSYQLNKKMFILSSRIGFALTTSFKYVLFMFQIYGIYYIFYGCFFHLWCRSAHKYINVYNTHYIIIYIE